jgi:hypothetical protein
MSRLKIVAFLLSLLGILILHRRRQVLRLVESGVNDLRRAA